MQFNIISVGKCRDKAINSLCAEYTKRLSIYGKSSLVELAHGKGSVGEVKSKEADSILAKIKPNSFVIALDERGKSLPTRDFAKLIEQKSVTGFSSFDIIIGGAEGLDDRIRNRADLILSFSELTFPHMLVRVILLEQLYRVMSLINNHPYHREG